MCLILRKQVKRRLHFLFIMIIVIVQPALKQRGKVLSNIEMYAPNPSAKRVEPTQGKLLPFSTSKKKRKCDLCQNPDIQKIYFPGRRTLKPYLYH